MDATKNKAFLRARLKEAAQKREKRIDSPLVRYNDLGQPVCKVCNVSVKSESLWPAHLVSRQHKEAVDAFKAQAKSVSAPSTEGKPSEDVEASPLPKVRVSSSLPEDFFEPSKPKRFALDVQEVEPKKKPAITNQRQPKPLPKASEDTIKAQGMKLPDGIFDQRENEAPPKPIQETIKAQGTLPEGFFDNVDADHKARGLEPPKYDMKDEWKEFQKAIHEDIQEVDLRLEEEEFDAAEDREKLEVLEQRVLLNRVQRIRTNQHEKREETEIAEVIAKVVSKKPFININLDMRDDESSSDGDSEEGNLLVDWRAKQF